LQLHFVTLKTDFVVVRRTTSFFSWLFNCLCSKSSFMQ